MTKMYPVVSIRSAALACIITLSGCGDSGSSSGLVPTLSEPDIDDSYTAYACDPVRYDAAGNLRIYQVMIEAFFDGDPTANYNTGYGSSDHRGDIQGLTDSLDYIVSTGANSVWLTPVFESVASVGQDDFADRLDATGYFASNYFNVDPNFGTPEQLKQLVDEAHSRGLYVFLDGAFGHFKNNAVSYSSPSGLRVSTSGPAQGASGRQAVYPEDLAFFKEVATHWITEFRIDGWRLDQAHQVPIGAWGEIRQAVEAASDAVSYEFAGRESKPLGYMVGEVFDGDRASLTAQAYGTSRQPGLCSAFDFPFRDRLVQSLAVDESSASDRHAATLREAFGLAPSSFRYPDFARPNGFITNHDVVRLGDLLQRGNIADPEDAEYWQRITAAFETLAAYSGPITLYYDEEIGAQLEGFADRVDCSIDGGAGARARFCNDHVSRTQAVAPELNLTLPQHDREQALRQAVSDLNVMREAEPTLRSGADSAMPISGDDDALSSVFALLKSYGNERIVYLLNLAGAARTIDFRAVDLQTDAADTQLIDLQSRATAAFDANGNFSVTLAPFEGRFLKLGQVR